jgi:hypothetical protein
LTGALETGFAATLGASLVVGFGGATLLALATSAVFVTLGGPDAALGVAVGVTFGVAFGVGAFGVVGALGVVVGAALGVALGVSV